MKFYIDENKQYLEKFEVMKETLTKLVSDRREIKTEEDRYFDYWMKWCLKLMIVEEKLTEAYFTETSLEKLKTENHELYGEVLPGLYEKSFVNPVYMTTLFEKKIGQQLCYIGSELRHFIHYAYTHQRYRMAFGIELLLKTYKEYLSGTLTNKTLQHIVEDYNLATMDFGSKITMNQCYNTAFDLYTNIVKTSDLNDIRYLFKFGDYVTDNELETAQFLNTYSNETLDTVSKTIADAYVEGFRRDGKDITLRHNVRLAVNIGQEQITLRLLSELQKHNLEGYIYEVISTEYNKQYGYDHKFNIGLFLTEEWAEKKLESFKLTADDCEKTLKDYSGILYVERFGEEPFSPVSNDERIKLDESQQVIYQSLQNNQRQLTEKFIPEQERSFCIVAFPTPEIGEQFEEIFEDTLKINMLESAFYEKIQGVIIDALDLGNEVRVIGKGNNLTDITVSLQALGDTSKETNFVNCVADVNIPVGEVFTSPQLKGTTGLLHIENVYLEGFNFENLKLWFKDGYIDSYECTNFEDMEKGKEFIKENLLFPHATLPIGEFAIGTNTLAYVIAEKYNIVDKLPILIVEKMGPHFAIGDTCFSWSEDTPVFNQLDGKEIIARDNEHSLLRKEDVSKAYTNCHTDITIPYDALKEIYVSKVTGEKISIIKEGRFVLEGTEALNEPFDQLKK